MSTLIQGLERKISDQDARTRELRDGMAQLRRRLEQLDQRPAPEPASAAAPAPAAADAGDGAFDLEALVNLPGRTDAGTPAPASPDRSLVWVEPLRPDDASGLPAVAAPAAADDAAAAPGPRFVIPPSVLSGRSLTALVGRVPRGGAVQDPWPFLAVSGRDNLSANNARFAGTAGGALARRGAWRRDAGMRQRLDPQPGVRVPGRRVPRRERAGRGGLRLSRRPRRQPLPRRHAAFDRRRGPAPRPAGPAWSRAPAAPSRRSSWRPAPRPPARPPASKATRSGICWARRCRGCGRQLRRTAGGCLQRCMGGGGGPCGSRGGTCTSPPPFPWVHDPAQRVRADRASAPAAAPGGLD